MASAGRKVTIEFIGKDAGLGNTASDLERKFGTLGARMNRVGQVSGRILAGGLLLAGAAAVKAGQAAADDEAAQAQLAQQLRKAAGATDEQIASTEEWIAAQGRALGITDDELRPAMAKLATATGDVGEAQKLATLAMDVAAGTGKDLNSVTEALVKAQNGSVGGLSRLGIATKDAEGKTLSLTEVTQKMADKYKGAAANAADTTAGKQRKLQVAFGELQEEIGAKLIPSLTKLATVGLTVVNWIDNNQTTVAVLVGTLGSLLAITWAVTKAIAVWTAITKVAAAAQIIFTNVQWALNLAMAANPIGLVVLAVVALVAILVVAYKKSETFRAIVDGAFRAVQKAASFALNWIKGNWPLLLAIITGPIGLAVLAVVKNWDKIKAGAALVRDVIADKFNAAKDAIVNAVTRARERADAVWDAIKIGFGIVKDRLVEIASSVKSAVSNAFDAMLQPIQDVIDKIQWLIDKIKSIPTPDIPFVKVATGGTSASAAAGTISRTPPAVSARGGRVSGGTVSAIVQFVLPGGKVIEQQLIQWSRETGRPLQVRTI